MTVTRFCDSTGLRALVLAHKQAAAQNTELRLVITSAGVLRVLASTHLDTVLASTRAWPPRRGPPAQPAEAHNRGPAG